MLLQFVVENFRSFKEECILNMIPAKKTREHKEHVLRDETGRKVEAVPFVAMYGANASGKSNLVSAISFAKDLVVNGTRGEQSIPVVPFRLNAESQQKGSRFEFVIKHQGVLYTYGFLVSASRIEEEWLFAVLNKQEVRLFERVTTDQQTNVEFGNQLAQNISDKRVLEVVARTTRPNQLFLTEANDRNVEMLKPLMRWFRSNLQIISPDTRYQNLELRAHNDDQFIDFLQNFLKQSDFGISGVKPVQKTFDLDEHFPGMPDHIKDEFLGSLRKGKKMAMFIQAEGQFFTLACDPELSDEPVLLALKMQHKGANGEIIDFDAEDESDGTLRMMHLLPSLLDLQQNENVYIIDEIDRSMHPLLSKLYVQTFLNNSVENPSNGQLIVTTHDTALQTMGLRRDEIWFMDKDDAGVSKMYSLAEFKVRNDLKIDKGYLNGRFGGIPFIGHQAVQTS